MNSLNSSIVAGAFDDRWSARRPVEVSLSSKTKVNFGQHMNKVRVLKETKITKIIYRGLEKINSHSVASTQTGPTLVANELESERKSDENWSK